ncbi:MAG TPA: electron transport complex subunit RsxE [Gammaproteobacteria bacterium]
MQILQQMPDMQSGMQGVLYATTQQDAPAGVLRGALFAGLWSSNPVLVQLLGLCPLLAITTTAVYGFALGVATTAVLVVTNAVISAMRRSLVPVVRIPLFVLIIASLVTCIDLLTNAFLHDLHEVLGLFIPLIVTNCAILAQAETVASRRPVWISACSGFATGLGFCLVLVALGALREAAGQGTLLAGTGLLLGGGEDPFRIDLPFDGVLAAVLPPGAFFGLAVLLAIRNLLTREPDPSRLPIAEEPASSEDRAP